MQSATTWGSISRTQAARTLADFIATEVTDDRELKVEGMCRVMHARGTKTRGGGGDDSDNEVYLNANANGLIKQLAFEGRRR